MTTKFAPRSPGSPIPRAYPSKFDRGATHRVEIDGEWHTAETMEDTVIVWSGDAGVTRAAKAHALAKLIGSYYGKPKDLGYVIPAGELPAIIAKYGDRVRFREAVAASEGPRCPRTVQVRFGSVI